VAASALSLTNNRGLEKDDDEDEDDGCCCCPPCGCCSSLVPSTDVEDAFHEDDTTAAFSSLPLSVLLLLLVLLLDSILRCCFRWTMDDDGAVRLRLLLIPVAVLVPVGSSLVFVLFCWDATIYAIYAIHIGCSRDWRESERDGREMGASG
jgi:hypothetical protein